MNIITIMNSDDNNQQLVLDKTCIQKAPANSLSVSNNQESYNAYFKMGGTVGKMTLQSAINYKKFIEQRIKEREEGIQEEEQIIQQEEQIIQEKEE